MNTPAASPPAVTMFSGGRKGADDCVSSQSSEGRVVFLRVCDVLRRRAHPAGDLFLGFSAACPARNQVRKRGRHHLLPRLLLPLSTPLSPLRCRHVVTVAYTVTVILTAAATATTITTTAAAGAVLPD